MTTETLICRKFTAKQAIQSLITGLDRAIAKQGDYKNFKLDMNSFGDTDGSICYGCAATVALQELVGYIFPPETYSNKYFDTECDRYTHSHQRAILNHELSESYDSKDIGKFEAVVDYFRSGDIDPFYKYFDKPAPNIVPDWCIENHNVKEELPKIKVFYNKVYS